MGQPCAMAGGGRGGFFFHLHEYLLPIAAILCTAPPICQGQCPSGSSTTFEKVAGMYLVGMPMKMLYRGQGEPAVTKECIARCRSSNNCHSFVLNYNDLTCMMPMISTVPGKNDLAAAEPPQVVSYFEKICLSGVRCQRLWAFERVVGYELSGFDDRTIPGVTSRIRCEELCLREKGFLCRSGEFDYGFQQCRLSAEDRRSQPLSFRAAFGEVDYFDNQCLKEDGSGCSYEGRSDADLERTDAAMTTSTAQACQQQCEAMQQFICHAFSFRPSSATCHLSSDDTYNMGSDVVRRSIGTQYYQKSNCLDIKLACSPEGMLLSLSTREPFSGRIYSLNQPHSCQIYGQKQKITRFTMPVDGRCGIALQGDGQLVNTVVIQQHPLIQQRGDKIIKLYCSLEEANKTISKSFRVVQGPEAAVTAVVNATAPTPNIRLRITDANGTDIQGTTIGSELFFRIELDSDSAFGIFARDLVARNGKGDAETVLIDDNGCPTQPRIFPAFEKIPGTKSLQAKFPAFKFNDDPVVRFDVNVHFCLDECPPANCPGGVISYGKKRRRRSSQTAREDTTETPIIPDYPLVAAIIVESNKLDIPHKPLDLQYETEDTSEELVCTTKTVIVVLSLGALFLQIGLIAACATGFLLCRKDRKWSKEDTASTILETLPSAESERSSRFRFN